MFGRVELMWPIGVTLAPPGVKHVIFECATAGTSLLYYECTTINTVRTSPSKQETHSALRCIAAPTKRRTASEASRSQDKIDEGLFFRWFFSYSQEEKRGQPSSTTLLSCVVPRAAIEQCTTSKILNSSSTPFW